MTTTRVAGIAVLAITVVIIVWLVWFSGFVFRTVNADCPEIQPPPVAPAVCPEQ